MVDESDIMREEMIPARKTESPSLHFLEDREVVKSVLT